MDMRSWDEIEAHYRAFSGKGFISETTLTRPANTTQYAAGDQVAGATVTPAALIFGTCATYDGGGGLLNGAVCIDHANQATKPNLRLYLFNGSPTLNGDNVNWNPGSADLTKLVAMAEFTSWEIGGTASGTAGNCFSFAAINKKYRVGASDTQLYGAMVERGTYTPVASEAFTIRLQGEWD